MSEIVIRADSGQRTIEATVIDGSLAVHRMINRPAIWTITHIKSGLNLGSGGCEFSTEEAAVAAAEKIGKLADWSLDGRALLARHPDLKAKIARIARKHGSVRAGHA